MLDWQLKDPLCIQQVTRLVYLFKPVQDMYLWLKKSWVKMHKNNYLQTGCNSNTDQSMICPGSVGCRVDFRFHTLNLNIEVVRDCLKSNTFPGVNVFQQGVFRACWIFVKFHFLRQEHLGFLALSSKCGMGWISRVILGYVGVWSHGFITQLVVALSLTERSESLTKF